MKYPQIVSMPSAVSNWLEEQLEARGIDAVVYTRYVLSLLHRDPVDVICPDQDLHFAHPNKEVRRSGGNRKRFRHSAEWWRRDQADADKLKRSAAVECLMSASDQKCGIESLVDELCEKLKEINSTNTVTHETPIENNNQTKQTSPQDSAKRYYAAFPPLSRDSSASANNIITLIPKWFGSPKKKVNRKQARSASYDDKLHCKIETENMKARAAGKQRHNYFGRNKNGYCRTIAKSMEQTESTTDWSQLMFANNVKNKHASNSWPQTLSTVILPEEQCLEIEQSVWENDDDINMYEDLPVDIRELLDSPVPQDDTVELMNLANMRDTGSKNFISCGTNITSSIWSNDANMVDIAYDNTYNSALDANQTEMLLDLKFSSISINKSNWPSSEANLIAENETNVFFENLNNNNLFTVGEPDSFADMPWNVPTNFTKFEKWSEDECFENEMQVNIIAKSFLKLNHNKEESSFIEVFPKTSRTTYNVFNNGSSMLHLTIMRDDLHKIDKEKEKKEKDDLLTSAHSHFRPITDKVEKSNHSSYVDGTTFIIPSSLEKIPYKRSESGTMYLECEYGIKKKYSEYRILEEDCTKSSENDFVLKFNICENDKACQTDCTALGDDMERSNAAMNGEVEQEDFYFLGDQNQLTDEIEKCTCTCNQLRQNAMNMEYSFGNDTINCPVHYASSDSMVNEIVWKSDNKYCEKCNKNRKNWNDDWLRMAQFGSVWNKQSLRNIWNGGEVCFTCLGLSSSRPPLSLQQSQLREDISQDGEQLLSDLSSLQKTYMEELPMTEVTCDISELVGPKERKRRHSFVTGSLIEDILPEHRGSWSFASRLEEDCLIQMSTIPTLRSVTL